MKNLLTIVALLTVASLGWADEVALWKEKVPGYRKPVDLTLLPEKIFGLRALPEVMSSDNENAKLKSEAEKVASLKITGLIWSDKRQERRVLMGDIVMREGQAIPSYVFNDGRYYILVEIGKDRLRFRSEDVDQSNPFAFEVPFGLKNPVRNQSDFSSSKDDKK